MTDEKREPQTWWIDPRSHSGYLGAETNRNTAWKVRPSKPWAHRCVPVIEASAYDALKAENEKFRAALEKIADVESAMFGERMVSYADFELRDIAREALK